MKTPNPQDILPPLSFDTMHSTMHSDKHKDDDDIDTSDDDSTFYGSYNSHTDESSSSRQNRASSAFLSTLFQGRSVSNVDVVPDNAKARANVSLNLYLTSTEEKEQKRECRWTSSSVRDDTLLDRRSVNPIAVVRRVRGNRSLSPRRKSEEGSRNDEQSTSSSSDSSWSLLWERFNSGPPSRRGRKSSYRKRSSVSSSSFSASSPTQSTISRQSNSPRTPNERLEGPLAIPTRRVSLEEKPSVQRKSISHSKFQLDTVIDKDGEDMDTDSGHSSKDCSNGTYSTESMTPSTSNIQMSTFDIIELASDIISNPPLTSPSDRTRRSINSSLASPMTSPRSTRNTLRRQSIRALPSIMLQASPKVARRRHSSSSTTKFDSLVRSPVQPMRRKSVDTDDDELMEDLGQVMQVMHHSASSILQASPRETRRRHSISNLKMTSLIGSPIQPMRRKSCDIDDKLLEDLEEIVRIDEGEKTSPSARIRQKGRRMSSTRRMISAPEVTPTRRFVSSRRVDIGISKPPFESDCSSMEDRDSSRRQERSHMLSSTREMRSSPLVTSSEDAEESRIPLLTRSHDSDTEGCSSSKRRERRLFSPARRAHSARVVTSSQPFVSPRHSTRKARSMTLLTPSKAFVPSKAFATPEQRTRDIANALTDPSKAFVLSKAFASPNQRTRDIATALDEMKNSPSADWNPETPSRTERKSGKVRRKSINPGRSPSNSASSNSERITNSSRRRKKSLVFTPNSNSKPLLRGDSLKNILVEEDEHSDLAAYLPSAPLDFDR